ncbi:MAG: glutamine-hydrolyzing carbamoyl-phosphate synthase small subunit [Wenzhouxiangellaceae bacterium]
MTQAVLALADGTVFYGRALGAHGITVGEVVFNTAMSGYQEILSDPSYTGQIVTLTASHIGNVGCNPVDMEQQRCRTAGLVVRDCPRRWANWRGEISLDEFLRQQKIVGITDLDTRALTRHLREHGAMPGCIMSGGIASEEDALTRARECRPMQGQDLASVVSTHNRYEWTQGSWDLDAGDWRQPEATPYHVVAYDFGVKHNILRLLVDRGCRLTVVPAKTPAAEVMALQPDGVFLSNGPGDPEPCDYAVSAVKELLEQRIPLFGICLGHQLLALAAGGRSIKMKFGHHGANHPVLDIASGRVMITSQNHGFAVDADSLPDSVEVTHRSLFDNSLQGIAFSDRPAFGFQGHPEASPGPHDAAALFDRFIEQMAAARETVASA